MFSFAFKLNIYLLKILRDGKEERRNAYEYSGDEVELLVFPADELLDLFPVKRSFKRPPEKGSAVEEKKVSKNYLLVVELYMGRNFNILNQFLLI